jgi:hypothetical protein
MKSRRWIYVVVLGALFALVLGGTVAFRNGLGRGDDVHGTPTPIATAQYGGTGPGSLVSAQSMPNLDTIIPSGEIRTARVVYRSTEGDTGATTEVSGVVFAPTSPPPPEGWPVLAYAHGSIGIDAPCAPSLSPDLVEQGPLISAWVRSGYAVAFPDYQGLGASGVHPYGDARTAGFNLIDAVRALRSTFPGVSGKWAGYGPSQGGGAVWAANEQAATYAPELQLVGTTALAPATTPSALLSKAESGTLSAAQAPVYAWVLASMHRLHPELNLNDYRRGSATQNWDAITACSGDLVSARNEAFEQLTSQNLTPASPQAAQALRDLLTPWDLPQRPLSAPLSVIFGGRDPFIDVAWVKDAIERACATGGTVVWRLEDDRGHADLDAADQVQWLADRFAGKPVFNYCQ